MAKGGRASSCRTSSAARLSLEAKFARTSRPGESQRRLDRRHRHRRNCRYHGGAAVGRKRSFSREHLNVLRGNLPW